MSKMMRCREVGMDCDFEARAKNEPELMKKVAEHAKSEHGIESVSAELAAKVKSVIHDE